MKKHLIATAVAAAVAVPAMAQNVTISGRIDTSLATTNKNSVGNSQTFMLSDVLTSNELVIGGSEDLGGGLKANFRVATPFASDSNAGSSTTFNFGGRGMTVGLSGGFGSVNLGRSAGTTGNSVMASSFVGNIGNLGTITARPDNSIDYTTPIFSNFSIRALYSTGAEKTDKTEGVQSEVTATYSAGPLLARLYRGSLGAATGSNDSKETGAQVNYDFGMAAVNFRYIDLDVENGRNSDVQKYGVGVRAPIGNGLALVADYSKYDLKGTNDANDSKVMAVGIIKDLSKRTNVYAVYAKADNNGAATRGAFGSSTTATVQDPQRATAAGEDPHAFAIGIRHSF